MIDAIDSYIRHVRLRMATINPTRSIKGPMDAFDWPTRKIESEALYLLTLNDEPIGSQGGSQAVPIVTHMVQWSWVILGDDIAANVKGRNRGNRYRVEFQIKEELRQASYPGFTEKLHLTAAPESGSLTFSSLDPKAAISWTRLEFRKDTDKNSGVVYGIATTYITQITDAILS